MKTLSPLTSLPFTRLLQRMVNPTAPTAQSEEAPGPAEPGISGLHPTDHHHHHVSAPSELNPSALHKRLLQVISPSTSNNLESHQLRQTSSAPDLSRSSDSLGASSASHAHTDHDDAVVARLYRHDTDVEAAKLHRLGTDVVTVLTVGDDGPPSQSHLSQGGGANTPSAAAPRPPLLSKKLLEPKHPVGQNPSFRECLVNTLKYSWLNLLLIIVPVRPLATCSPARIDCTHMLRFPRSRGPWT